MATVRPIFSLIIKDEVVLHKSYMPFIKSGGLFIPFKGSLQIGDEVFLLLQLIDLSERIATAAKVVWITFPGAMGNRIPGIGVQFEDRKEEAKIQIENILAARLDSGVTTSTL